MIIILNFSLVAAHNSDFILQMINIFHSFILNADFAFGVRIPFRRIPFVGSSDNTPFLFRLVVHMLLSLLLLLFHTPPFAYRKYFIVYFENAFSAKDFTLI